MLAVRRGDLLAADLHLARAEELVTRLDRRGDLLSPGVLAERLAARGEAREALRMVRDGLDGAAADPVRLDELVAFGARCAADLAEAARDARDRAGETAAREQLELLLAARARLPGEAFTRRRRRTGSDRHSVRCSMPSTVAASAGREASSAGSGPWTCSTVPASAGTCSERG